METKMSSISWKTWDQMARASGPRNAGQGQVDEFPEARGFLGAGLHCGAMRLQLRFELRFEFVELLAYSRLEFAGSGL